MCDLCGRRRLLMTLFGAAVVSLAPRPAAPQMRPPKRIRLINANTGERIDKVYWADGDYLPDVLEEISVLLRDHRTNEVKPIAPELVDLLQRLQRLMGTRRPFHVGSGYRSPTTNELLRSQGVPAAKNSLHTLGRAVDVSLPGVPLERLHRAAVFARVGGVGRYENSGFLHLDTGSPRRRWQQS